jgi:membrane-bound metal-dependent hydrolase YbcI (DUF457 family)
MFIGHFGVGFAAKRIAPRVSLGTAFLAAQFIDLLWPTLLLLGLERVRIAPGATAVTPLVFEHYPITHSLLAVIAWAIALAGLFWIMRRNQRGALVVAALVVSHWLLDAVVHAPDLPLTPGGVSRVGLGLWNSPIGTLLVEVPLFALGVWLYARSTRATDQAGRWGLWLLVAFLLLVHAGNMLGPPPPSVPMIAWAGHAQWLLVLWAYWLDRHREALVR